MPAIDHIREELKCKLNDYKTVEDFLGGPTAVRQGRERYLPMPEPVLSTDSEDVKKKKEARYTAYLTRAVFYDAVAATLGGLIGQVFAKDTAIEVPTQMDPLVTDIDHAGTPLEMQAKKALWFCLGFGRGGLFTDYPNVAAQKQEEGADPAAVDTVVTVKDMKERNLRPKIILYSHSQIINWRVSNVGGRVMATLVVLKEEGVAEDDGFEETKETQYRVLRLSKDLVYSQEVWKPGNDGQAFVLAEASQPIDANGNPFQEIPFSPFGWESNTFEPDSIPLLGLAELAAGLWRNSADYQENVFYMGQSTVYFSGLSIDWVKEAMKNGVRLGSREAVLLPVGGTAGIIVAEANTQVVESMRLLMEQMVALGAKLVEVKQGGGQKSATEDANDEAAQNSVLSSSANNVSSAYVQQLKFCARFMGIDVPEDENADDALDFQLNTDFALSRMTSQDRQVLLAEWQGGALTWEEYRWNLKRAGLAYEDDKKAKDAIDKDQEQRIQDGLTGGIQGDPGSQNQPPGKKDPAQQDPNGDPAAQ